MMGVMAFIMVTGIVFAWQGNAMHARVKTEEAAFHQLQSEYFTLSKVDRDAAATDSTLNQQLVQIQNYPSTLLELKLLGAGKILTGIFALLFGILMALVMMPKRLAAVLQPKA